MRIIAGLAKGKLLSAPKGRNVRFTADKIKGSLFNILGPGLTGKSFLDLFAGVGSVGIEALSREADFAVFVERNRQNANYIKQNLKKCHLIVKAKIFPLSFKQSLSKLSGFSFDHIYLDPPYSIYSLGNILHDLVKYGIIRQFSKTIVEHRKKDIVPLKLGSLNLTRQKIYGQTVLSFYKISR